MDVIRRTDLERLALQGAGPSVSLLLPTQYALPAGAAAGGGSAAAVFRY